MASDIEIRLKSSGAGEVKTALEQAARGAAVFKKGINDTSKEAQKARKDFEEYNKAVVAAGLASKWSPNLSIVKQESMERRRAADATKEQAAETKRLSDETKKQAAETKRLSDETKKYGGSLQHLGSIGKQLKAALSGVVQEGQRIGDGIEKGVAKGKGALLSMETRIKLLDGAFKRAQDNRNRFSNIEQGLGDMQSNGTKLALGGGAVLLAAGKAAVDAGTYNRSRDAISKVLGKDAGEAFLIQVQNSDFAKVFGVKEAIQEAQTQVVVGGFKPEELINRSGTGLLQTLGAMAAAGGGTAEGVTEAMRQVSQIRRKGQAEKNDLDVIAESGGIDIYGLITGKFGQSRTTEVLKGEKPLTYAELSQALQSVPEFKGGQFKDALGDAASSLPGQLQAVRGEFFLLSQDLGQSVVPVLSVLAGAFVSVSEAFRGLPDGVKTVIVWTGIITAGLVAFAGVVMVGVGALGIFMIGLGAATIALPILGAMLGAVALGLLPLIEALVAFGYVTHLIADASKMDTETLKEHHKTLGALWEWAANLLQKIQENPILRTLWSGSLFNVGGESAGVGESRGAENAKGDAADKANLKSLNEKRAKEGKAPLTMEQFQSGSYLGMKDRGELAPGAGNVPVTAGSGTLNMGDIQKVISSVQSAVNTMNSTTTAGGGMPAIATTTGVPGAFTAGMGGGPDYLPLIRDTEDKLRALKGIKGDDAKAQRDQLNDHLVFLRRQQQDTAKANRAAHTQQEQDEDIRRATLETQQSLLREQMEQSARLAKERGDAELQAEIDKVQDLQDQKRITSREGQRRIEKLRAAYEAQNKLIDANNEMRVAQLEAEEALQRSRIEAENQTGKEREKTLKLGELAAQKILGIAKIHLDGAQQLVNASAQKAGGNTAAQAAMNYIWGKKWQAQAEYDQAKASGATGLTLQNARNNLGQWNFDLSRAMKGIGRDSRPLGATPLSVGPDGRFISSLSQYQGSGRYNAPLQGGAYSDVDVDSGQRYGQGRTKAIHEDDNYYYVEIETIRLQKPKGALTRQGVKGVAR